MKMLSAASGWFIGLGASSGLFGRRSSRTPRGVVRRVLRFPRSRRYIRRGAGDMYFRELNRAKCKTYLLACERARTALIVDPLRDRVALYLGVLAYHGLRLEMIVDTHTHADHR